MGPFQLVRRIAVGGMGEVFEGHDGDQRVAIKVLLPELAKEPSFVRDLEHEAKVAGHLVHPNIVRVHGFFGEPTPHLVMDLVDGLSLHQMLRASDGKLEKPAALSVMLELLAALQYSHTASDASGKCLEVVHRDLSTMNVMIAREGRVRLTDFGIARSNLRHTRTRTGLLKGNLRYLSPEQATGSTVDARSDIYVCGLLLYELLSGHCYLDAERDVDLVRLAEDPPLRCLADIDADLAPFDAILRKAVARFPEQRFSDAAAFDRALRTAAMEAGLQADAASLAEMLATALPPLVAASPTSRRPRAGRRLALVSAAAVGAAAIAWAALPETAGRIGPPTATPADASQETTSRALPPAEPLADGDDVDEADERVEGAPSVEEPTSEPEMAVARGPRPSTPPPRRTSAVITPEVVAEEAPMVEEEAPVATEDSRNALRTRYRAARARLAARGLSVRDLDPSERERVLAVADAIEDQPIAEASTDLRDMEQRVAGLRVDRAFVGRKLRRVNGLLRRQTNVPAAVQQLSAIALQDVVDGRYERANERLDEILRSIGG